MRTLLALLTLAIFVSPGCLEDGTPRPGGPDEGPAGTSDVHTETTRVALVQAASVDGTAAPARASARFAVPAGTLHLEAAADWSCVTNCPLVLRLVAPDGTVQAEDSGWGLELAVAGPTAGAWTAEWWARDGATVGVAGEMVVTFTVQD